MSAKEKLSLVSQFEKHLELIDDASFKIKKQIRRIRLTSIIEKQPLVSITDKGVRAYICMEEDTDNGFSIDPIKLIREATINKDGFGWTDKDMVLAIKKVRALLKLMEREYERCKATKETETP